MFSASLGFGGRIGRLRYFSLSILLVIAMGAALVATAVAVFRVPGVTIHTLGTAPLLGICAVFLGFSWASYAIKTKRIRDIGWPPAPVIAVCFGFDAFDYVLVQADALHGTSSHFSSALGTGVNVAVWLILVFWPGRAPDDEAPTRRPDLPGPRVAELRSSLTPLSSTPGAPTTFGRRR